MPKGVPCQSVGSVDRSFCTGLIGVPFVVTNLLLCFMASSMVQGEEPWPGTRSSAPSAINGPPSFGSAATTPWPYPSTEENAPGAALYDSPSSRSEAFDPAIRLAEAPSLPAVNPLGVATQSQDNSVLPPGTRDGIFQKLNFWGAWMPRMENDSIGLSSLMANAVFGFPFPERETPLVITPQYRVLYLDGPDFTDAPSSVHEAQVEFHHFRKLSDRWLGDIAVTVGVYGDEESLGAADAFRVTGRAVGIYQLNSQWKAITGVVYLNRAGYSVVPAAGLTYDRGDFQFDLVFPRPRVAWRLPGCVCPGFDERWVYLLGELGGNIWAVRRASGADDTLQYADWRIILGYERKLVGGVSQRWEMGYVFNRDFEYDRDGFETALDDSAFLRLGLSF